MDDYEQHLSPLIARVSGAKKNSIALVIPSGQNTALLSAHLAALARQEGAGFDVLVIGEPPPSIPKAPNILFFREAFPLGSSGSFSVGQVLGFSLGYGVVINADLDCLPASGRLISSLASAALSEGKAILPLSDEEGRKQVYCINRYGAVPKSAFEKIGFEYAPLFKGAEDIDLQLRLEAEGLLATKDGMRTSHPFLSMAIFEVASGGAKYLYYHRATFAILNLSLYRAVHGANLPEAAICAARLFYNYFYVVPYSLAADSALFAVTLDGFLMGIDRRYSGLSFAIPHAPVKEGADAFALEVGKGNGARAAYFEEWEGGDGILKKILRRLSHPPKVAALAFAPGRYFLPSAQFIEAYGFLLPYLMFIKPVIYKGAAYSWRRGPLFLAAGIAATLLFAPLFPLVAAFSLLKIFTRGDYPPKAGKAKRMLKNFASASRS